MKETLINNRWRLLLPNHRAARPEWPEWEKERLSELRTYIDKNDIVFEIGAEEGDMSALISQWCDGNIVLFEPNPKVWPNIKAIWEANRLKEPLGMFVGFASNEDTYQNFENWVYKYSITGWPSGKWPKCASGELIGDHGFRHLAEESDVTPQVKIDTFSVTSKIFPTIINIDVEGAEFEVLKGAENVLKSNHPMVFVSIHPEFMYHHFQQHTPELFKYMKDLGYEYQLLAYDHELHCKFTWQYQ